MIISNNQQHGVVQLHGVSFKVDGLPIVIHGDLKGNYRGLLKFLTGNHTSLVRTVLRCISMCGWLPLQSATNNIEDSSKIRMSPKNWRNVVIPSCDSRDCVAN